MKKYIINVYDNNYRTNETYTVIAKDKLNAVKEVTIRLINEYDSDIDDMDIQYIEELIENDEF